MEVKPSTRSAISIVETDLKVDFAAPLGYDENQYKSKSTANSTSGSLGSSYLGEGMSIEEHLSFDKVKGFQAFVGQGAKLSGKSVTEKGKGKS